VRVRKYAIALAFATGATIGGIIASYILSVKHEKEMSDACKDIQEFYADKTAKDTEKATVDTYKELERVKSELNNMYEHLKNVSDQEQEKEKGLPSVYILKPDEFGTIPDYDRFYYTYCTDDGKFYIDAGMDTPAEEVEIEDMFKAIHPEQHFGEYEDDAVYIRNDELKTDIVVYLADEATDEEEDE